MIQKKYFSNYGTLLALTLGMTSLVVACGDSKKTDENLQQAFELHQEAVEIRQMADKQIDQLKANEDSLFVNTYTADLESISRSLKEWDEQLVEVPGFEHDHDHDHDHSGHDHDHDHDHGEQTKLTPEQHLQVQQHLLEEIKAIAEEVNQVKEK
ncbi:hypothetical protein [Tunicatimonas pelagia]|uniref:hypothetical protein n=1 Tax=Tunicatimonas pelagia TaxID=931531 RepID=UPI0026659CA9|nr:hypothetical protein [Tunicatimonas pelagia]WKN44175.1 hypothetical protein P0M28_04240 [Tunicatimonas pelagia]